MTPMVHLLLLLLLGSAAGKDLEERKGVFENKQLDVAEGTPVPYPVYQFQVTSAGVNGFRLSGEGGEYFRMSHDGWLYLETPLVWSQDKHYTVKVEALADNEVVGDSVNVTINVLDINNNAPFFNQSVYPAVVREHSAAGVPFTRVFASDRDNPETPNARLSFSLVGQFPNSRTAMFEINQDTGEISTTAEGQKLLKAREGVHYSRGEDQSIDALKTKFNNYCPVQNVPLEQNPFFTCVERAELRRRNLDPLEDPDYTLYVRVQDLGGQSENALSGNTRVQVVVQQNLWVNPGPLRIRENLEGVYPLTITKVRSNDPDAIYTLVQKERELKFPFNITPDGDVQLTEPLDREDKDAYILVVLAKDKNNKEVDPPMEILVEVDDVNDNAPTCEQEESEFELQENEPSGSVVGDLLALDNDQEGTLNSKLTFTLVTQNMADVFSIDASSGRIQALRSLQRRDQKFYHLNVRVSDPDFSTECKVVIKVIDVNNELPLFEKNDYGSISLAEDVPVGHTLLTIKATDADEPDSGSSAIDFHISGDDDGVFGIKTDGNGVGQLVVVKPLDFESSSTYNLKIDARNPEPLMKGLQYGRESTAVVSVSVTDVDEAPRFDLDVSEVTVFENITKGSVVIDVEAKDPEGKEISFKLDGDVRGWLEIDAATGQIRTKGNLDRETAETLDVTITAFEKENPSMSSERVLTVRLLDVNDNYPKLTETQAFICVAKPEPVIITAYDPDTALFSGPFTFTLEHPKKSPNWVLSPVDGTSVKLTLKKRATEDKTFSLPIIVKDSTGMGVPQRFEVRVCNCTELGYCYVAPEQADFSYGMGPTIGILAGTLGFSALIFIIAIKSINKSKKKNEDEEEDRLT